MEPENIAVQSSAGPCVLGGSFDRRERVGLVQAGHHRAEGRFLRINFQNFLLCNLAARLAELAGSNGPLPGFETEPVGCELCPDDVDTLLCAQGGWLEGGLVVDLSCGSNARMAPALREGARDVQGIRARNELSRIKVRLFMLGCTPFSLEAEEASANDASWRVPPFLHALVTRAVALVEAPSAGLLARLARFPWAFRWSVDSGSNSSLEPAQRSQALDRAARARVVTCAELGAGHAALFAGMAA